MLRFIDSFDDRATAAVGTKYNSTTGTFNISGSYGRNGTSGILSPGSSGAGLFKTLDNQSVWVIGMAFYPTSFSTRNDLIVAKDAGTDQYSLQLNTDGTLSVYNGFGTGQTLLGTTSNAVSLNTWYYIELYVTVSASVGTCEVRINGVSGLSLTGVNTAKTGNSYANSFGLFGAPGYYDDLYIFDGSGTINKDFIGDARVECLRPSGTGLKAEWTPVPSGSQNWENVDDTTPDDDTTYNHTTISGYTDLYTFSDLVTTSGSIYGTQVNIYAKKDDAGSRTAVPVFYVETTEYDGSSFSPGDTYTFSCITQETDPSTSSWWTVSGINNSQYGLKLVS